MATPNQSLRQAQVRAQSGTARNLNEDWHAYWDLQAIPEGNFNERMLQWINQALTTSFVNVADAMQAYAEDRGFLNWSSMNDLNLAGGPPPPPPGAFTNGFSSGFS